MRQPVRAAAASLMLAGTLCGCGGGERADAAARAAVAFHAAWARQDGATACGMLAAETAAEVAESAQRPCARGVLEEELSPDGRVRSTAVWGRAAQVRLGTDTLFLALFPDGWKVQAAGCSARAGKPYDCTVRGG